MWLAAVAIDVVTERANWDGKLTLGQCIAYDDISLKQPRPFITVHLLSHPSMQADQAHLPDVLVIRFVNQLAANKGVIPIQRIYPSVSVSQRKQRPNVMLGYRFHYRPVRLASVFGAVVASMVALSPTPACDFHVALLNVAVLMSACLILVVLQPVSASSAIDAMLMLVFIIVEDDCPSDNVRN